MAQIIDGEEYLDIEEVTALLGVKKATVYAYVSRGVLRSFKQRVGRGRLYRRDHVEALCAVHPSDTPPPLNDRVLRDVDLPEAESWVGEH
jgi:excisionase family DNA binding protein